MFSKMPIKVETVDNKGKGQNINLRNLGFLSPCLRLLDINKEPFLNNQQLFICMDLKYKVYQKKM